MSTYLLLKPVQIPSFICSGTMVIKLCAFNDKKKKNTMDKMQKLNCVIIWPKSGHLMNYMVHIFLLTCSML